MTNPIKIRDEDPQEKLTDASPTHMLTLRENNSRKRHELAGESHAVSDEIYKNHTILETA